MMKPTTFLFLVFVSPFLFTGCGGIMGGGNAPASATGSSGGTKADAKVERDTLKRLGEIEVRYVPHAKYLPEAKGASAQRGAQVTHRRVVGSPDAYGAWTEDWTVARDGGVQAVYTIVFAPGTAGSKADISIKMPPRMVVR